MEILQHYIFINRSGSWYDFFANAIGATIGVLIYPFVIKWLPLKRWRIKNNWLNKKNTNFRQQNKNDEILTSVWNRKEKFEILGSFLHE